MPRRPARSALALPFILAAALAAPGTASAAFDADGFAFQPLDHDRIEAPAADETPDGGFVLAAGVRDYGNTRGGCIPEICGGSQLTITRLGASGEPVTTWGDGGTVAIPGHDDAVSALRVLADGTIVLWSWRGAWLLHLDAAGKVLSERSLSAGGETALQDGVLDAAGVLHTFTTDFENERTIVGTWAPGADPTSFTVEGFMATAGSVDGKGRVLLVSIPQSLSGGGEEQRLIRLRADGTPDPSFPAKTLPATNWNVLVTADRTDRPVLQIGSSQEGAWRFVRYTEAGELDPSLGGDGDVVVEDEDLGFGAIVDAGYLTAQDDGKLVATGLAGTGTGNGIAVLRLGNDGAPDKGFDESAAGAADGDGIVVLDRERTRFENSAPTAVEGGVVVAFAGWEGRGEARSMASAPAGGFTGLLRRAEKPKPVDPPPGTGETPDPGGTPQPDPQPQQPAPVQAQAQSQQPAGTPAPKPAVTTKAQSKTRKVRSCLSRRKFTIRLRPKALRSATVQVAGERVAVKRNAKGRLTATVDLRKLKQATFEVKVTAIDAEGRRVKETRRYRTCRFGKNGPKVKGGSIIKVVQG